MKIYTGNAVGKKLEMVKLLDLGIMISSSPSFAPRKEFKGVPCALDNGAFSCWKKGFPFQEDVFLKALSTAYRVGLTLDFIVCPDIVAGGLKSLNFSLEWASQHLPTAPRLALAIQDGMELKDVSHFEATAFTHLFVGGTKEWKWANADKWVNHAHKLGLKCHIGQVGSLDTLRLARDMGADSVDSTNFVRNESWNTILKYYGCN